MHFTSPFFLVVLSVLIWNLCFPLAGFEERTGIEEKASSFEKQRKRNKSEQKYLYQDARDKI